MSGSGELLRERQGDVLQLRLNRPAQRNALSLSLVAELQQALQEAEQDGVRVLVLRGSGGHFCAGGDIADMAQARGAGRSAIAEVSAAFGRLCAAYAASPLAVVVVVEGLALGGGFGLACTADVLLAGRSASFRLPETSLGLVPAQIAPLLLERIGASATRRLALSGGRLDAEAALRLGLAHEVHDDAELDGALARVVAELLRAAPGAVAATKRLLTRCRPAAPAALIDEAAAVFADAVLGSEGSEGTRAFLERRAPAWVPA